MINERPLSTKQRNSLKDSEFGIPELRAYPLNDVSHVEQAVRMFNHVDPEYEKELADNLNKAIKKLGLSIEVGDDNRFKKYVKERKIIEATPDVYKAQKKRLRDNKRRQIEAIDKQAQDSKDRIRAQYRNRIDMINRASNR